MTEPADLGARIRPLLAFLPQMESRYAGKWDGGDRNADGSINMPWFDYDAGVLAFIRACGENGWLEPYDWNAWQTEALKYVQDPEVLRSAGEEEVRKLLTLHIRRDRFHEGHLAAMVENGHLAAVLRRLEEMVL